MDITELILKFGWIGWEGNLEDIDSLFDWLYKEYQIILEKSTTVINSYTLWFQGCILCRYYGIKDNQDIVRKILPDVTLLWNCENGELIGPLLDNYEEPNIEWS